MSRVCTICTHEGRELIEAELLRGVPLRNIATTYRLGYSSVRRHREGHMLAAVDGEPTVVLRLEDVMSIPVGMKERADLVQSLLNRALRPLMKRGGRLRDVPLAFVVSLLKLQQADEQTVLRVTGLMNEKEKGGSDVSSFLSSEEYRQLMEMLDAKLEGHPEVKLEIAQELLSADAHGFATEHSDDVEEP
jgi:hypothetical protein